MTDVARARRLADRIKVVVAEMLERGIKDPRLGFITITDARVTPDLREATVFYTVLGDDVDRTGTAIALESARGVLRKEIGVQCRLRFTPTLTFSADPIPEDAQHIEELLALARTRDAEVAAVAVGAEPAGEADPYRHPVVDVDDDESDDGTEADETGGDATA